ncbi:anthranilate synthase component I family protein [Methanobrevibacter sp. 87.7]|uniref:anthranilate synthase component I family protein n=1 Tax=Methanobrevibacter sp. 87.7 TaxID=387957 RepID=UPI0018E9F3F0|nr:chorismate-binding protein [Methanobrevibacter sp. 87.7]
MSKKNIIDELKDLIAEKPKIKEINIESPFILFKNLYYNYKDAFILESMENDSKLSRFSIVGFDPIAKIKVQDHIITVKTDKETIEFKSENPFLELKKLTNFEFKGKGFYGGLLGYVSYESIKYIEDIPTHKSLYPDFEFGLFLDCVIQYRINNTCKYITFNKDRQELIEKIYKEVHSNGILEYKKEKDDFTKEEYINIVKKAKESINNGEIFQVVLSNSEHYILKGSKLPLYEHLRKINPSPYMYHIKLGDREIIGSSPEMLMRLEDKNIESYPIAGTRPRGKTPEEDKNIEKDLLNDKKECAEHLMLVDLSRNDVGKVSKIGTVNVPELYSIRKFSHVQHIVSHVTGEMKDNLDAIDGFMSLFPAGTLSGAPKIRAMKIINDNENFARGPYGGAVGYFSLNGNADFAITIRTLTTNGELAEIQAGAGIVYDSIPENEYEECARKRQAIVTALEESGDIIN